MNRDKVASELVKLARELVGREVKLDERDDLMREMKRLIGTGDFAIFDYRKTNGSVSKRKVEPVEVFKAKGRPAMKAIDSKDGIEKFFYLDMIGEEQQEQPKPVRLNANEMLKDLQKRIPELKEYWFDMGDTTPTKVKMAWEALAGERGLRKHLIVRDYQGMGRGPYGSMERTKLEGTKTYMDIYPGKSFDPNRVKFYEKSYSYWTDDEGNRW
jgi:hypothetical protein